jgi:hypothetical protein
MTAEINVAMKQLRKIRPVIGNSSVSNKGYHSHSNVTMEEMLEAVLSVMPLPRLSRPAAQITEE